MAKIELSRNIVLSFVDYLEPLLIAEGYTFTFVSDWGADDDIVMPQDYESGTNKIVLPAGKFTIDTRSKGGYLEVGGSTMETYFFGGLLVHATTEGQAYDLLDFLHDRMESGETLQRRGDNSITVYDYTTTGYPANTTPPTIGDMQMEDVRHRYISDLGSTNMALKHAGNMTFSGMIYLS